MKGFKIFLQYEESWRSKKQIKNIKLSKIKSVADINKRRVTLKNSIDMFGE